MNTKKMYGIILNFILSTSLYLTPLSLYSDTKQQTIYVGVEPFITVSLANKLLNKVMTTANSFGLHNTKIIETYSFKNFIELSKNNSYSLFYSSPSYASYLMSKYNYIPVLALKINNSAAIIKSSSSNIDLQNTTKDITIYTLPDYDIFTLAAKSHLKKHTNITYSNILFVDRIIINVLQNPNSLGIVASSDIELLIPKLKKKVSIVAKTNPVEYSYILLHPRHKKHLLNIKTSLFRTHKALSQERDNYFYKVSVEHITDKHINDINKYSNIFNVFENFN